jgi:hypothetical protein
MGAVAGDAIEGISLLNVLNGRRVAVNARRAKTAALAKFGVLAASLGYLAAGRARQNMSRRGRPVQQNVDA